VGGWGLSAVEVAAAPPPVDLRRERTTRHRHRHRLHSVTALLHPPECGMSRPPCGSVSASCNLPVGPDGWPRSGVLTWAVSPPFPAVTPLVGPHSRDEAADLTATTGQAGTCWTSAKRLDSEASRSEPRHQTIGRRSLSARVEAASGEGRRPAGIGPTCPPRRARSRRFPCPRLHEPGSRRDQTPICRAGARFEPGDSGRRVSRIVPIRLVATWTVAPQGPSPRPDRTCKLATAWWPARHPSVGVCSSAC
jgi:hypothetical protein